MKKEWIIIRGGGDIASGVAYALYMAGYKIIITEIEKPTFIRTEVSYGNAIYKKRMIIEGIESRYIKTQKELDENIINVIIDTKAEIVDSILPLVIIDATISKKNIGLNKNKKYFTIALGPGYDAGKDCDIVIETNRGHNLGKIIFEGTASPNTGKPANVLGYTEERVIRSPENGKFRKIKNIGDIVMKNEIVGYVGEKEVKTRINGIVRGLINEIEVTENMKIGDVDPRERKEYAFTISDKAKSLGGATLIAVENLKLTKLKR